MNNIMLRDEKVWIKRLEGVDKTPEGLLDVYGSIQIMTGQTRKSAHNIWERIKSNVSSFPPNQISKYKFLDSIGRKKALVPVLNLAQILAILPHLPGKVGKQMAQAAVNLGLRTAAGDADVRMASMIQEQRLSSEMKNTMMTGLASSQAAIENRNAPKKDNIYPVMSNLEDKLRQKELEYRLKHFDLLKDMDMQQIKNAMRQKRKCNELKYDKFKLEREEKRQRMEMDNKKLEIENKKLDMDNKKLDIDQKKQTEKFEIENKKLDMEKNKQNVKLEMDKLKLNKELERENKRLDIELKERSLKMELATTKLSIDKQKIENETSKVETARRKMHVAAMKDFAEKSKKDDNWSGVDEVTYNSKMKGMFDFPSETTSAKILKLIYSSLGDQIHANQAKRIASKIERCYLIYRHGNTLSVEEEQAYLEKITGNACVATLKSWMNKRNN
jgi:hypothetical protein